MSPTTFHDAGVVERAKEKKWAHPVKVPSELANLGWIHYWWLKHPEFASFRPEKFIEAGIIGPALVPRPESIGGGGGAYKFEIQKIGPLFDAPTVTENELGHELFILTQWAVRMLNIFRFEVLKKGRKRYEELAKEQQHETSRLARGYEAVQRRTFLVEYIEGAFAPFAEIGSRRLAGTMGKASDAAKEVASQLGGFAPELQMLVLAFAEPIRQAASAARIANQVALDFQGIPHGDVIESLGIKTFEFAQFFAVAPALSGFRDAFVEVVKKVLALEGDPAELPPMDKYFARLNQARTALLQAVYKHIDPEQAKAVEAIRIAVLAGRPWQQAVAPRLLAARSYARIIAYQLHDKLGEYVLAQDSAQASRHAQRASKARIGSPNPPELASMTFAGDYRAKHMRETARVVDSLGVLSRLDVLSALADPVLHADLVEPMKQSAAARALTLIIEDERFHGNESTYDRLLEERSPDTLIEDMEPLTLRTIVHFLETADFKATTKFIDDALDPKTGSKFVDKSGAPSTKIAPKQSPRVEAQRADEDACAAEAVGGGSRLLLRHRGVVWGLHHGAPQDAGREGRGEEGRAPAHDGRRSTAVACHAVDAPGGAEADGAAAQGSGAGCRAPSLLLHEGAGRGAGRGRVPTASTRADEQGVERHLRQGRQHGGQRGHVDLGGGQGLPRQDPRRTRDGPPRAPRRVQALLDPHAPVLHQDLARAARRPGRRPHDGPVHPHRRQGPPARHPGVVAAHRAHGQGLCDARPVGASGRACHRDGAGDRTQARRAQGRRRQGVAAQKEPRAHLGVVPDRRECAQAAERPRKPRPRAALPLDDVQTGAEKGQRTAAEKALKTLYSGWLATAREIQGKFGLEGNKGSKSGPARGFLRPASGGNVIKAGAGAASLFEINGIRYVLKDVFEDFTYFNPYRSDSQLGEGSEQNPTSDPDADASILYVGTGGSRKKLPPYVDDRKGFTLLKYVRTQHKKTTTEEITGDNDKRLRELSNAVGLRSTVVSLEALAEAIETFAGVLMDGIELIPGVGQAVAAARIATAVVSFMADNKFDALLQMIKEDPIAQIERGFAKLETILDPSKLWQFLFFGRFPLVMPPDQPPEREGLGRRSIGKRLQTMIARIGRMGRRLVSLFVRFQRSTMSKIDAARLFVLNRSPLAAVIAAVARYIHLLEGVSLSGLFGDDAKSLETRIQEGAGKLGGRVKSVFDGLQQMTIPKTILPVGRILEVVVELIARSLKGKYKYAAKGFLRILDLVPGKKKELFDAIGSAFEGTKADPNVFLVGEIKKRVNPHVKDGAGLLFDALHDKVGPFVKKVVGNDAFADALGSRPDLELKTVEGDEISAEDPDPPMEDPEAQPSLDPAARPRRTTLGPLPTAMGRALPGSTRTSLESRIGHDLGHVRIHEGSAAHRLNADLGASALTSGSHVFLGRGVNPSTGTGARILQHEVGHVLDQAGPRPLGGSFDSTPRLGAPGRGLTVDSGREAFADAVAAATRPAVVPSLGCARPTGLQPSMLTDVAGPLLEEVSSGARLARRAEEDVEHEGDSDRALSPNHRRHAENVWKSLTGAFKDQLGAEGTFSAAAVKKQILTRLEQRKSAMSRGLQEAAASALVLLAPATRGHDPIPFLDPHRFTRALVGLVFGGSGILLSLDTKKTEGSVPGAKREKQPYINPKEPVKSMKVENVDLAEIHGGDSLWQLALEATKKAHAVKLPLLTAAAPLFKDLTDKKALLGLRARLRPVLAGRDGVGVWLSSKFAFRKKILDELDEALKRPKGQDKVDPSKDPIPGRTDYLDHAKVETDRSKNIGLRIGRFAQKDAPRGAGKVVKRPGGKTFERSGQQRGLERESHHTTQFLLMEYFHGRSSGGHPFPRLAQAPSNKTGGKTLYPGLTASGKDVRQYDGDGPPMMVGEFFAGRGGLMPAVLIARVTHRSGGLHVSTKSSDFEGTNEEGQSWVVHGKFRAALKSALGDLASAYEAKEAAAKKAPAAGASGDPPLEVFRKWMNTHEADVKTAISTAMRRVYRWMYFDVMKDALRDALKELEVPYYNDLAEAANKSDRIDDGDMDAIAAEAEQNNARVMKESGFET